MVVGVVGVDVARGLDDVGDVEGVAAGEAAPHPATVSNAAARTLTPATARTRRCESAVSTVILTYGSGVGIDTEHPLSGAAHSFPGAWEDHPFGPDDGTVKVGPKIFAFLPAAEPYRVTLKVDPERGEALRGAYPGVVTTAAYLSKRHWVQILLDGTVDPDEVDDLLERSYELVLASLTRAQRDDALSGQNKTEAKVPTRRKPTRS